MTTDPRFEILQGDCLRLLDRYPDDHFDAVVADPPYSSGGAFRSDRVQGSSNKKYVNGEYPEIHGDSRDSHAWHRWAHMWISECHRVTRDQGYFFIFTDWRQLTNAADALQVGGYVWRGMISWDKGPSSRLPHPGYFRHQCEYILWGTKAACAAPQHRRHSFDGSISLPVRVAEKSHPTEKPVQLYRHLLETVPTGSRILDPFAGSGTSGQAALELGQSFTGIELSHEYAAIARARLAGVAEPTSQLPLFQA